MSKTIRNKGGTQPTQFNEMGVVFDANSTSNKSPVIQVDDDPIQVRAYGLDELDEVRVEMVHGPSHVQVIAPFCPFNGQSYLDYEKNVLLIGLPGRYRLVLVRKDESQPSVGLVTVTVTKIAMTQEVFNAYARCCGKDNLGA